MAGDLVILFRFAHRTKRWEPDTVSRRAAAAARQ